MPPIPTDILMEESECYLCLGISQYDALELALLNRIAEGGGGDADAVWGAITGTLSNQTDLQAALDAKTDVYSLLFYNSAFTVLLSSTVFQLGQCGTASNAVQATYNNVKATIPVTGTVVAVTVNQFSEAILPSTENIALSLNKNAGTLLALGNIVATPVSSTLFSGLAFAVAAGDFLSIQITTPLFVTPPQNSRWTANILIQKT